MTSHTYAPTRPEGRTRRILPRALAATALVAAAALALPSPALAHDELVGSHVETTDAGAAETLVLTYSDAIMEVGTEIMVTGPDGSDATDGAPAVQGRDVRQPLADDLSAGTYDIVWRVVSSDGHPIEGVLAFEVPEDADAEVAMVEPDGAEATSSEADEAETDEADAPEGVIGVDEDEAGFPWATVAISVGAAAVLAVVVIAVVRKRKQLGGEHDA